MVKLSIEDVKKRIKEIHGDEIVLDEATYVNTYTNAKFIDKDYGEWWTTPSNVIYHKKSHRKRMVEKTKKKWLEKYGVDNVSKCSEIMKKILSNQTKKEIFLHWKTNEKIICTSSYECKIVNWLNENKIDYRWQIPFSMSDGRKYIVDLLLIDDNIYVEIKGHFWKDAKEKWDWFHSQYPNSELWERNKLRSMGFKVK